MRLKLNNRGDTIVEVLIAVIVLSTVLTTVYALATQTLHNNQSTQEHAQAIKIAQGQVESLKAYTGAQSAAALPSGAGFCLYQSGGVLAVQTAGFGSGVPAAPGGAPEKLNLNKYPANCTTQIGTVSTVCNTSNLSTCYFMGIQQNSNLFTVTVRWASQTSSQNQATLLYRYYP